MNQSANNTPSGPRPDSIWGSFFVTYNVVDNSGKNVDYAYQLLYSKSGHFTNMDLKTGESGGTGSTYPNGTTYGEERMWPVNPGDYIVFGASNNSTWLSEDLANKQFNPGESGYWTTLTYDNIIEYTKGDPNITINITTVVFNETGKMLKQA